MSEGEGSRKLSRAISISWDIRPIGVLQVCLCTPQKKLTHEADQKDRIPEQADAAHHGAQGRLGRSPGGAPARLECQHDDGADGARSGADAGQPRRPARYWALHNEFDLQRQGKQRASQLRRRMDAQAACMRVGGGHALAPQPTLAASAPRMHRTAMNAMPAQARPCGERGVTIMMEVLRCLVLVCKGGRGRAGQGECGGDG